MAIQEKREGQVWLQYYGWAKAKPANEFKVGDTMMWNYGMTSKVVAIREVSKAFLEVTEEYTAFGGKLEQANRRLKKDRLVAYK